jgi:hypothetical protein
MIAVAGRVNGKSGCWCYRKTVGLHQFCGEQIPGTVENMPLSDRFHNYTSSVPFVRGGLPSVSGVLRLVSATLTIYSRPAHRIYPSFGLMKS